MFRGDFAQKLMNNTVAQALNFGSRWLLNLAVARHLTEHEFGVFSLVYMLANLWLPTLAFGANVFLIHETAKKRDISELIRSFVLTFWVCVVAVAGLLVYQWWATEPLPLVLYFLALLVGLLWALSQQIYAYLKGAQQFKAELYGQLLSAFFMILMAAVVVAGVLDSTATVMACIAAVSLIPLLHGLHLVAPELTEGLANKDGSHVSWSMVKQRISYAWHDVFAIYLTNIPFVFLSMFSTLAALGAFRKSFVLFMPVTLLPVVFSQVLLSRLSSIPNPSQRLAQFKRVFLVTFPLLTLPYVALAILNPWFYPLLLNESLNSEMAIICSFVVATLWLTLAKTYAEVWLTSLGFNHWRALVVSSVAIASSLLYLMVNHALTAQIAAWIFFGGNALAVIVMALCGVPAYRRYVANFERQKDQTA